MSLKDLHSEFDGVANVVELDNDFVTVNNGSVFSPLLKNGENGLTFLDGTSDGINNVIHEVLKV